MDKQIHITYILQNYSNVPYRERNSRKLSVFLVFALYKLSHSWFAVHLSIPSILSSTSEYNCLNLSIFCSEVSQYPRPLASKKVWTNFLKEFGFLLISLFNISSSWMKVELASSYTQLSTWPEVALHPTVLVSLFSISRTPSYPLAIIPSYHLGFNNFVRASRRTVSERVRTCNSRNQFDEWYHLV